MKQILLCLAVFAAVLPAEAIDKDKPVDLTGNWKEARRISPRKERLDFTDTTFYEFLLGNEYTTHRMTGFIRRGTYKASKSMLDLGLQTYNVLEMTNNRMVLRDDGGSYEFVRYEKAAATTNNSAASSGSRAKQEDLSSTPLTAAQLAGKWEVYKRINSAVVAKIDNSRLIKLIDIKANGTNIEGSVGSNTDMASSPSWKVARYSAGIIYCNGRDERQLKVVKCKDGELIVQEGITTYFFKQFE